MDSFKVAMLAMALIDPDWTREDPRQRHRILTAPLPAAEATMQV